MLPTIGKSREYCQRMKLLAGKTGLCRSGDWKQKFINNSQFFVRFFKYADVYIDDESIVGNSSITPIPLEISK